MSSRTRDEQEARNAAEVMAWIEHLTAHADVPVDLDLICHINRLTLRDTDRHIWAGRPRAEVDWQQPEEWSRPRANRGIGRTWPGCGRRTYWRHSGALSARSFGWTIAGRTADLVTLSTSGDIASSYTSSHLSSTFYRHPSIP